LASPAVPVQLVALVLLAPVVLVFALVLLGFDFVDRPLFIITSFFSFSLYVIKFYPISPEK
jgi:hypothetical protein